MKNHDFENKAFNTLKTSNIRPLHIIALNKGHLY